jgi:hypothetical protein
MHFRSVLTALVALAASISIAGPLRLATNFFIPAGRTNPVILAAKVDDDGNLGIAAEADLGPNKQIVITRFTAAGVRLWSSTINTPVSATAPGQLAAKFQLALDGRGNTLVLSPRAGNPDFPGSSEDLILRRINDSGQTVGYLSLVRSLHELTGQVFNIKSAQMQAVRWDARMLGLAITAVGMDGLSNVFLLHVYAAPTGTSLRIVGYDYLLGQHEISEDGVTTTNFRVVGLQQAGTTELPLLQVVVSRERSARLNSMGDYDETSTELYSVPDTSLIRLPSFNFPGFGVQYRGHAASETQSLVVGEDSTGQSWLLEISETGTWFGNSPDRVWVPSAAARVGNDWMLYAETGVNNEIAYLWKYTAFEELQLTRTFFFPKRYRGDSLVSSRGRAYLAGGPQVGSVQGVFSSFSSDGDLIYSAGQTQPFTLSTSLVVPGANNRFWSVGTTSTGLQSVILWEEPRYFVGISTAEAVNPNASPIVTVKAHLNAPAPTGGYTFNVSVSSNLQDAPRTVTVPAGATSATFTVKVKDGSVENTATVTARTNATHDVNVAHTATFRVVRKK